MSRKAMTAGDRFKKRISVKYNIPDDSPLADSLRLAANALDRAELAQAEIDEEGLTIMGLHSQRAHPAVAILRDAEAAFLRFTRAMGMYEEDSA